MRLFKRLLLLFGLLYLGLCALVYFAQEWMIFHPYPLAQDHEYKFIRPFDELDIEVAEGVALNAIHFTLDRPEGIVLFWHGNTGNVEVCSPIVGQFLSRGYEVLVVDYRGYGKSDGERSQETLYADGLAVYDYLRTDFSDEEIVLYGQSLGSGVAIYTAANRGPSALILEAPYASIEQVAKAQYPFLPTGLLLRFPMPSYKYIDSVRCPITIFHGTDDEVIPYAQAQQLAAANSRTNLITLQGGGHNSSTLFQEYQEGLDEALLGYVRSDMSEVSVTHRRKRPKPLSARVETLQTLFNQTAEPLDNDSLWLLYFRSFPRTFSDFTKIYGTADTTRQAPLAAEAETHLTLFFEQVTAHRQIRPQELFVGLASGGRDVGGAADELRRGIQDAFLASDSLYLDALSTRSMSEQERFWDFYLTDLLITDGVRTDLLTRVGQRPELVAALKKKLVVEEIEEEVRDTVFADSLKSIEPELDKIKTDSGKDIDTVKTSVVDD